MIKNAILGVFSLLLNVYGLFGQYLPMEGITTLDTIYGNEHHSVALFFSSPIKQAITGSEDFIFTYDKQESQPLGLLKASEGKKSNLLVLCQDESVYSFVIIYAKELPQLNYFISDKHKIAQKISPVGSQSKSAGAVRSVISRRDSLLLRSLLSPRPGRPLVKSSRYGITMQLEDIVFHQQKHFFIIRLFNNSTLDYQPESMNFYLSHKKVPRRTVSQRLQLIPLDCLNPVSKIKSGNYVKLIFVFSKFSVSNKKEVIVGLNEQGGERNLKLTIPYYRVNNPRRLNK